MKTWAITTPRQRSPCTSFEDRGIFLRKASSAISSEVRSGLQGDYALLLRSVKNPAQGHLLQARIKTDGLQDDPFLNSLLIQMYGKCGSLCDARILFESMLERPMLAWKSIIRAYVQAGHCVEALHLFQQLLQEGFFPDKYTIVSVLTACANKNNLTCGRHFHAIVVGNCFISDIAVETALVNMYGKCDCLMMSVEIFNSMHSRHVIVWNVLIAAHVKHNQGDTALVLFYQMQQEGVLPNSITFINVLSLRVASCCVNYVGEEVHAIFYTHEFRADIAMGNALLNMYCTSGWLQDASVVFDGLLTQNLVSWTSMIEGYSQQGQGKKAFQCFEQMQQQGVLPDQVTYIGILQTCASMRGLFEGKRMHARLASNGMQSSVMVGTALVQMYGSCGNMERATTVLGSITHPNLLSWTSMIALQSQQKDEAAILQSFMQMVQQGFMPDKVVFFSLLDACYKRKNVLEGKRVHCLLIGASYELDDSARAMLISLYLSSTSLEEARKLFDTVSGISVLAWTVMITSCTENGQDLEALQLFFQMQQEGILPEHQAFVSLLRACSNLPSLFNGRRIHTYVTQFDDISIEASLINMYGKCGDVSAAQAVFNGVLEHGFISWTALLAAYVQHGSRRALQVCKLLVARNYRLDDATFLQALLVCCRFGIVDEALVYFVDMVRSHPCKLGLDHFCCMIDLFGRVGLLEYAEAFTDSIPCQPSAALWMALLGACRQHVNVEWAKRTARYVAELNQSQGGHYVVLSNVYALSSR
ncbi:hypothetical protein GOP47_0007839 [Adiantum capillus-veneris]|uniref:Pentatricopeptide repeat-containing protein n=1 Tax=Adiantum capillus-veneris TaxID=13818 RepID=A0A9D4V1H6_ADICA|nr:hypothetical protein GOP47_0007839 [Adiantum capillus-veneris]